MDLWYSKDKWVAFIFWQLWTFADIKCQQPNKITLKPQQKQHKSEFFHALVAPKLLSLPLGPTLASREWSCTIRSSLIVGSWLAETRIWNNIPVPPLEINTPILRPLPVTQNKTVFFFHILPNFKSNYLTIEKDKQTTHQQSTAHWEYTRCSKWSEHPGCSGENTQHTY